MLLSEMFGVKRDTEFGVEGYSVTFKIATFLGEYEYLMYRWSDRLDWREAEVTMLCNIIAGAPGNIIHLPPPLTDEQRAVLMSLFTLGYRWLAKDDSGATYAYDKQKLAKGLTVWVSQGRGCSRIHDGMAEDVIIPLVSWSDPEPYDIGKALGVGK